MKKLIYVVFGVLLFTALSCEKEVFYPNDSTESTLNKAPQRDKTFDDIDYSKSGGSNSNDLTNGTTVTEKDTTHVITDPNRDEDDIRKSKPK